MADVTLYQRIRKLVVFRGILNVPNLIYVEITVLNFSGRGSPRTSQSPFGNSPDPMLMSPQLGQLVFPKF
jgi:hypothetical protein